MKKHRQMTLFMHIVNCGSISKAAEKLDLSKSVLSSALKQLESDLSTVLLKRTTRKQHLTPQGEAFYQHCLAMNDIVDRAWDEMLELQNIPSGKVTITAPHALMEGIITTALAEQFKLYPDVQLELLADDHQLDLMQSNIDIAIRVGESPDSNYKQRKIGSFRDVLCCSESKPSVLSQADYIANHWQPKKITHKFEHLNSGSTLEYQFTASHTVNSVNQVASMIRLGMGIGLIPEFILKRCPQLFPCLPEHRLPKVSVYAIHPYPRTPPIAVSLAIQSISKELSNL